MTVTVPVFATPTTGETNRALLLPLTIPDSTPVMRYQPPLSAMACPTRPPPVPAVSTGAPPVHVHTICPRHSNAPVSKLPREPAADVPCLINNEIRETGKGA